MATLDQILRLNGNLGYLSTYQQNIPKENVIGGTNVAKVAIGSHQAFGGLK